MKKTAILGNGNSSQITDRVELVELLHTYGIQPYSGRIMGENINEYYSKDTAIFFPISASRSNTNPLGEIKSIISVAYQIRMNGIDSAIIYGVKNHAAMGIGAKIGGAKRILCVVNGSGNLFRIRGTKGKLLRFIAFPMLRIAYKISSDICFQNQDDLYLFRKKGLINRKNKVFITGGSGVNLNLFPSTHMPQENRFLFLSRITETKGLKEFCEAARIVKSKYKDAVFDIVGPLDSTIESGNIKTVLEKAVNDKIVNYYGPTTQVPVWLQKCRYFVYPSYYPEGIPRCVLQALSTGRPIITCNTPGCKETVIEGKNGVLVNARDIKGLAEKMVWMIEHPSEVERMGKASREIAEVRFDVYKINNCLLRHLMGRKRVYE